MNPRNFFDTSDVKFLEGRKVDESISFLVLLYFLLTTDQLSSRFGAPRSRQRERADPCGFVVFSFYSSLASLEARSTHCISCWN